MTDSPAYLPPSTAYLVLIGLGAWVFVALMRWWSDQHRSFRVWFSVLGVTLITFIVALGMYSLFSESGWRVLVPIGVFLGLELVRLNFRLLRNQKRTFWDRALRAARNNDVLNPIIESECEGHPQAWLECAELALRRDQPDKALEWAKRGLETPPDKESEPLAYERLSEICCLLSAERQERRDEVYRLLAEHLSGELYKHRYGDAMRLLGPELPTQVRLHWAYCALRYGDGSIAVEHWRHIPEDERWHNDDPEHDFIVATLLIDLEGDVERGRGILDITRYGSQYWVRLAKERREALSPRRS